MDVGKKQILVIQGHPDWGHPHLCHALAQAYRDGAQAAGHAVEEVTPVQQAFPLLGSAAEWQHGDVPASLLPVQQAIMRANHLLLLYPLWLGDMPASMKGFLEQVARPGFAIAREGRNPLHPGLLGGRSAHVLVTMGMPALLYRLFYRAHSLKCLKRNMLGFVGIGPVRTTVIGSVADMPAARFERCRARMERLGRDAH
ncbi:MAG: NAD(P)H-dependent oxidoreductase [Massilia sp.]|nr:NAD(P)H-dependent oxidoreductase [Massilia sp.]